MEALQHAHAQVIPHRLAYALSHAARGWAVFPLHEITFAGVCSCGDRDCKSPGKHPRTFDGFKSATREPNTIRAWWAQWPGANIGGATGAASGRFVIDLDRKAGRDGFASFDALAARLGFDMPDALAETPSGGLHLYYRHEPGLGNTSGKLGPGIDTRGDGGYVVLPGSLGLGGAYVEHGGEIGGLPPALIAALRVSERRTIAEDGAMVADARVLVDVLERWSQRRGANLERIRPAIETLDRIRKGEPYAEAGSRDDATFAFLREFVPEVRGYSAASLASLFSFSVARMGGEPDHASIADKITRIRRDEIEAAINAEIAPVDEARARIRRAFHSDRDHPYTSEELAAFGTPEERSKRWIVQTAAGYFVRVPDGFHGPHDDRALPVAARDLLAPASSSGVETDTWTKSGERVPKSAAELAHEFGSVPASFVFSLFGESSFDGREFVQRVAPLRAIAPRFDPQIAEWLRLLAGPMHDRLLDWLATVTDLRFPTAAVWLMGEASAGKSLFAEALARLWHDGAPTTFANAVSDFNAQLRRCPLVFADEEIRAPHGVSAPDALKSAISDSEREIADKHVKASRLRGALRVVLAANTPKILRFARELNGRDLDALDQRVLYLEATREAAEFLRVIGGRSTTERWVLGDAFAAHVLALGQARHVERGARFLVQGSGGLRAVLASEGSGSGTVLRWIARSLGSPFASTLGAVRIDGPEVWINARLIRENWPTFSAGDDMPDDFGEAVRIATEGERRKMRHGASTDWFWKVRPELLQIARKREDGELIPG